MIASFVKKLERPCITVQVRAARLRYWPRALLHAPDALLYLLDELGTIANSWSALLVEDLVWLKQRVGQLESLPDPQQDIHAWEKFVVDNSKIWPAYVKKALQEEVRLSALNVQQAASDKAATPCRC